MKKIATTIFAAVAFAQCAYSVTADQISELGLANALNIQANPELDPSLPSIAVSNIRTGGTVETGFLLGTSAASTLTNSTVTSVEIALDGGSYTTITGTTTWTYQLPTGASTWRRSSRHTIQVRALAEDGNYSATATLAVFQGRNKDVNGDGYPDLAVGANTHGTSTGRAYVFHSAGTGGIVSGSATGANTILTGDSTGDEFGKDLALGDVNGDGYADLIVGAPEVGTNLGLAYIFHSAGSAGITGGAATTVANAIFNTTGAGTAPQLGQTVELGDINGDGYDDAVVGSSTENGQGRVRVYHSAGTGGIPGGGTATAATDISPGVSNFGESISTADVNGDGFLDLLVGANANNGAAYLLVSAGGSGIASGVATAVSQAQITGETNSQLGHRRSVLLADVNGDGFADVIVGAPFHGSSLGRTYIFYSAGASAISGTLAAAAANTIITGTANGGRFGGSLSAGDVNGDGFPDLAVGAPHAVNHGQSYLFESQGATGIAAGTAPATPKLYAGAAANGIGASTALHDLNGDGYADYMIGAHTISDVYMMNGGATGIADQDLSAAGSVTATITGENASDQFGFAIAR